MHTEKDHISPDELAKMGYERRDINMPALRKTIIIFYVFAVASSLIGAIVLFLGIDFRVPVVGWRVHLFDPFVANTTTQQKLDEENRIGRILPASPNPLLQGNVTAKLDIQTMRQAEDARLSGTGYTDATKTRAYIPIDKAMDLIVERGLPQTDTEVAKPRGNDMEPFGTRIVPQPDRTGSAGDATLGNPGTPVPTPSNEGGSGAPQPIQRPVETPPSKP